MISFRLFENYEQREGESIPQPDILKKIPLELQLAARELTGIVKAIFPGVTTKRKRDLEDWTKQQTCYINLSVTQKADELKETERKVLEENGYNVTELDSRIFACKPTDMTKNGNRVCKEVEIGEDGNLVVKFAGRNVSLNEVPTRIERNNCVELRLLCQQINQLKVCIGYESDAEGSWILEMIGGGEVSRRKNSKTCFGAVQPQRKKELCLKVM